MEMRCKWAPPLLLMFVAGCAGTSAITDRDRCTSSNPDIRIGGCTAIIQSGQRAPDFAAAFINRGTAYDKKGQYDLAIEDYGQALRLKPNSVVDVRHSAYNNRGISYNDKGQYDLAIQDLDQAIQLEPNTASSYDARGNSYTGKRQYDMAIHDYNQAIRLSPKFAKAFNDRAIAFRALGQQAQAAADFAKARQLDPSLPSP
jgi:tetratricopeptide (TPR) repeat protein